MPYSVIIGDTEGRAKSLSRWSGSVLKQKEEEAPASGCVRNCAKVFVSHVVVRVFRVHVCLWMQEFHVPVYQDTRQQRKTLSRWGTARDSNLQGSADRTCPTMRPRIDRKPKILLTSTRNWSSAEITSSCLKFGSIISLSMIVSSVSSETARTHARMHARRFIVVVPAKEAKWTAKKGVRKQREGRSGGRMPEKEKRRKENPLLPLVSRANSIFDCLASRHSRLRQDSKIDYSSITLRLVPLSLLLGSASPSSLVSTSTAPTSTSLLSPLSSLRFTWTRALSPTYSFSIFFEDRLRLLPFAPPLSRPDLGASRLHVACPNDVSERTGTTAI